MSHVHVHILPRRFKGDPFARNNDDIYPTLEAHEEQLAKRITHMERKQARTAEQGVQLDYTASSSEASSGGSATGKVATLSEFTQSSGGPTGGKSSSHESEALRMDNEERKPRSLEEMEREAEWLKTFMKEVEDEAPATSSTS